MSLMQVHTTECNVKFTVISSLPLGKLSCPDGWFPNGFSCYKASESEKPWNNAKQDCHASGGYLMKIDDASEQHFLEVYLRSTGIIQLFNVRRSKIRQHIDVARSAFN